MHTPYHGEHFRSQSLLASKKKWLSNINHTLCNVTQLNWKSNSKECDIQFVLGTLNFLRKCGKFLNKSKNSIQEKKKQWK